MKFRFFTLFASLVMLGTEAVQAQGSDVATVVARPAVRPLTRYLTATLRLNTAQAKAVQQLLRVHPLQAPTPERLTIMLSPILSYEAQSRLVALQNNAVSYQRLAYLTNRH